MRKSGVLLALGDSITYGLTIPITTQYGSYPAKVRKSINDNYGNCRLINKAISGWQTADFLASPYFWSKIEADLITIHIGTNDCNNNVPAATFQSNLEKIVDIIKDYNPDAEIIICSISRRSDATINQTLLDQYRTIVQTVATNKGTYICRFENAWAQVDTDANTSDKLHPNVTGHQKLHDVLFPVVQTTNFIKNLGK